MKNKAFTIPALFFLLVTLSTSCTKKIAQPETTSVQPAASTEKVYLSNVEWNETTTGMNADFDLPANTKDAFINFDGQEIRLIDKHPVRYMSCYWLYIFYETKGRIICTPISGGVLPVLNSGTIQIFVRR